jgi:SP family sugar:H+ symporter-like MFS transporter
VVEFMLVAAVVSREVEEREPWLVHHVSSGKSRKERSLGTVNVVCTFGGLYVVAKSGRRKALIVGALWAFVCFMIYAFVGYFKFPPFAKENNQAAATVLIVFTCLFTVSFATTWGPLVWAVVAELYPARYRATCMGLATASNWIWNFLISLFSTVIVDDIH